MTFQKNVPMVTVDKLEGIKEYYCSNFGAEVTFDHPRYLGLKLGRGAKAFEIAYMMSDGEQEPSFRGGVTWGLEVESADREHQRLTGSGLTVVKPLQDNPWGDRSFVVVDPAGVALYIHHPIPPSGEFA